MTEAGMGQRSAVASAGSFVGTFALIFAAMAGLFVSDTFLAGRERAASRAEARRAYEEGLRLERQGAALDAVERFRAAASAERENPLYQRALGAALLTAGELDDAHAVLNERLQRDPVDAEACLLMARVLARQSKTRQAIAFYHRAIYGEWEAGATGDRVKARFELVELLASQNARQELLAELLPLETEAPANDSTRKRIAALFTAAGAPARAIAIFRDVVRRNRDDADAFAGLAEAEFHQANYRSARNDFATALKLRPGDQALAARLDLCARVLALDPSERGLGPSEQYRRSRALLDSTLALVRACPGSPPVMIDSTLADSVRAILDTPVPATPSMAAVEANLDLVGHLAQLRPPACRVADSAEAAVLVLNRLAE